MNCSEKSIAFIHAAGALTTTGTAITVPDPEAVGGIYKNLTVVNDSDQDVKITYKTVAGMDGEFIVPKSIKGFTRALRSTTFALTNFKAISMGNANAVGNLTFNFSV